MISEEALQNCVIYTAPSKTFNLAGLQTAVTFIPNPELRKTFQDFMASNYLRTLTAPGFKACETGKGFERMNLACPSHVLLDALERIKAAWNRRNGPSGPAPASVHR